MNIDERIDKSTVFEIPNIQMSFEENSDENSDSDRNEAFLMNMDGSKAEDGESQKDSPKPPKRSDSRSEYEYQEEEEEEEEGEEEGEEEEEEEEEGREEEDYEDYSVPAQFALSYKKDGTIPEDVEIPKDLTAVQAKELVLKNWEKDFEESKENYLINKGFSKDNIEYVEFLAQGGDPAKVQQLGKESSLISLEIEGDSSEVIDNRKKIITAMYKDKSISDGRAEDLYHTILEKDEDQAEAETARKYFEDKRKSVIQAQAEQDAAVKEKNRKEREDAKRNALKIIDSKKIAGIPITKSDAEQLKKGLFERTEPIEYIDKQGKKKVYNATKHEIAYDKFNNDIEQQLLFALFLITGKGFNGQAIKQRGEIATEDDILRSIDQRKSHKRRRNINDDDRVNKYLA